MYKVLIFVFVNLFSLSLSGQVNLEMRTRAFYNGLNKGDSLDILPFFHAQCHIKHAGDKDVWDLTLNEFLGVCPKFKSHYYSEDIVRLVVQDFGTGFSYVDVYFDFYVEGSYTHSGVDHICWTYREGDLRIESIYSTDFSEAPASIETAEEMDEMMNKWHNDVAVFDYPAYFGFMTEEFIFLGTDPNERWSKSEFSTYAKPYFDRKSTWDFKTNWRNWYFSSDHKTAWFEESLATQMEECRGSGVLIKTNEGWKIAHYNLAVVIENEKMKKFIKLRRK